MMHAGYKEKFNPHRYAFTTVPCPQCKKTEVIEVPAEELFAYNQGEFIQVALKSLDDSQRERLMTGICGPCFDKLFVENDSEYNGDDESDWSEDPLNDPEAAILRALQDGDDGP